jgi:hypothetical protein
MKRSRLQALAWILAALLCAAAPAGAVTINPGFETGDTSGWTTVGDASVVDSGFGVTPTEGSYQLLMTTGSGSVSPGATETAMGMPNNSIRQLFRDYVRRPGQSRGMFPIEGSAVQQSFDVVAAGDYITFDWNFLTDEFNRNPVETDYYTDFLWGYLEGPGGVEEFVLAHANEGAGNFSTSNSTFDQETGSHTFTFTFAQAGSYTLTLGVHDVEDAYYDSGGILDGFQLIRGPEPDSFLLVAVGLLGLAWHGRRHKAPSPTSSS